MTSEYCQQETDNFLQAAIEASKALREARAYADNFRCLDDNSQDKMQLMSLPDDILGQIMSTGLYHGNWYAPDMAKCNKKLLSIMKENRPVLEKQLMARPWHIMKGVLKITDIAAYLDEPGCLEPALHYLEKGWIKHMELLIVCNFGEPIIESARRLSGLQDQFFDTLTGQWPSEKIVMRYVCM